MSSSFKSIKKKIAPYLHQAFYLTNFSRHIAKYRNGLRIIMYHGVGGGPDCPYDAFTSQMEYLAKNFEVISLKEVLRRYKNRGFETQVVLTFDDGLKNNFTKVYPILKRLNLPATFFVCPGLIESHSWVWAYEVGQRLLSCTDQERESLLHMFNAPIDSNVGDRDVVVESIVEWMKTLFIMDRKEVEGIILGMTGKYIPSLHEKGCFDTISWNELRMLPPELITIGSHSVNHPILTKLPHNEMEFEILESRTWLEKELSIPVEFFCYPNGDYDDRVVETVKNAYSAAVTTEPYFVHSGDDTYKLNRIPAAENLSLLAWRMFRPGS